MKHELANKIKLNECFCLICDEGTYSSNKELLSIVLRQVDEDFFVKGIFLRFCRLDNIKSAHIVEAIKDAFFVA